MNVKEETNELVNLTIANTNSRVLSPTPSVDSNSSLESEVEREDLEEETQFQGIPFSSSSEASFSSSSSSSSFSSSSSASFIATEPIPENLVNNETTIPFDTEVKEDKNEEFNEDDDDIDDQKQDELQKSWTSLTPEDNEKLDKLEALGGIYTCRPFNAVLFDLYHDIEKVKAALDQFHKVKS